jgi:hypothetical protein
VSLFIKTISLESLFYTIDDISFEHIIHILLVKLFVKFRAQQTRAPPELGQRVDWEDKGEGAEKKKGKFICYARKIIKLHDYCRLIN